MSWYRIAITLCAVALPLLHAKVLVPISDDELIVRGLLYDQYKSYEDSRQVYARLFNKTNAEVYLFKEAASSLMGKTHISESIKRLKDWDTVHPDTLEVKRLLIPLYLTINDVALAKDEAEFLIEKSNNPTDLELASNPFLYLGEFKRALVLLNRVYAADPKEMILLRMADIMDDYTHERKKAIQLLETHRRMNVYSNEVLIKLLVLYSKEEDLPGLLETYEALYENTKDEKVLNKIIDIYAYKKDLDGAISFLEKEKIGDDILYELYKTKREFSKALLLIDKQYLKNKNPKWLAEKGILLFESAKDKDDKEMIEKVVSLFEKAIKAGVDDSIYLNYYGYTLIDKKINIDRGMQIIEDALEQQPDNTYYLDSLAWGYYRKHQCSQAYRTMKRVVDEEGLKEDEIKNHWEAIKQCK